MTRYPHPAVENLPLYKAVDSGRRTNEVVVELDYRPASPSEILQAVLSLKGIETVLIEFNAELRSYTVDGAALEDGIYAIVPLSADAALAAGAAAYADEDAEFAEQTLRLASEAIPEETDT